MKFRSHIRCLLLISVILFTLLPVGVTGVEAEASTYFVSAAGSETPCSQSAPCYPDLALTYADPGDTIYFMQGTYTRASDPLLTITKGVYLVGGWNGASTGAVVVNPEAYPTIFDGVDTYRIFTISESSGNLVTITGFTFNNGYNSVQGGAIYIGSGNVDIVNSVFEDNGAGSYGGAIYIGTSGEVNILDSRFVNNSVTYGGGSVYASSLCGATLIEENVFSGGSASYGAVIHSDGCGLTINRNFFKDTVSGSTIDIYSNGAATVLTNNIIIRSADQAISFAGEPASPHQVINNTMVGGTYGLVPNNSSINVVNNIFTNFSFNSIGNYTGTVVGSTNLYRANANDSHPLLDPYFTDPVFVSPATDNYHISSDSPIVDVGTSVSLSEDFDGEFRPSGSGYDIGADEVHSGTEVYIPIIMK